AAGASRRDARAAGGATGRGGHGWIRVRIIRGSAHECNDGTGLGRGGERTSAARPRRSHRQPRRRTRRARRARGRSAGITAAAERAAARRAPASRRAAGCGGPPRGRAHLPRSAQHHPHRGRGRGRAGCHGVGTRAPHAATRALRLGCEAAVGARAWRAAGRAARCLRGCGGRRGGALAAARARLPVWRGCVLRCCWCWSSIFAAVAACQRLPVG
ncbi:hypothetical protein T492DRAFT_613009, partial [Pavlovales sp. CCMP2436]